MAILVKKIKKRDTDMLTQNTRYHKSTLTDNGTRSIVVRRNCINQYADVISNQWCNE